MTDIANNKLLSNDHPIKRWHRLIETDDSAGLNALLAKDAVFRSPLSDIPQRGRLLAAGYLTAAFHLLSQFNFRYVREIVGASDAMLEFEADLDGVKVNGVDLITWNDVGEITEVKVMLRPLQAIHAVHTLMTALPGIASMRGQKGFLSA